MCVYFTIRQSAESLSISIWTDQLLIGHHSSGSVVHLAADRQTEEQLSVTALIRRHRHNNIQLTHLAYSILLGTKTEQISIIYSCFHSF